MLLLAVVAPLLFFAGFLVKQSLIHNEMEEKLETASLQSITVNVSSVRWLKKNKEVLINGKMFDVRSYAITGNQIILKGLFDGDEDELHEQLKNMLQQKNSPNSSANSTAIKFLFPPLYNVTASITDQSLWPQLADHSLPCCNEKAVARYLSLNTPPPRFI